MIERRQVDRLLLRYQLLGEDHPLQRFADGCRVGFEQRAGRLHELFPFGIDVSLVRELAERVKDPAPAPAGIVLPVAHLAGDAVGGLEADAPDVVGEAVRILPNLVDTLRAVLSVDLGGIGRAYAVALEKQHHVLDLLLPLPALADLLHALAADLRHLVEPFDVGFDHFDRRRTESLDDRTGKTGADAFHQSAAEVFLDAVNRGRYRLLPRCGNELAAVTFVHFPLAPAQQDTPHGNFQQVAHERNQIIVALYFDFQYRIPVFGILIGDAFHHAAKSRHRRLAYIIEQCQYSVKIRKIAETAIPQPLPIPT